MILIRETEKQAAYYRKQQKVYEYAMSFWKELLECGDRTKAIDNFLPIHCFNEMEEFVASIQKGKRDTIAGGMRFFGTKQALIRIGINGDSDRLSPSLKRVIRHEIIHYFLWIMDIAHNDDDLEFWCYCYAFDGGAYQELSGADKDKYNLFVKVFDDYICNLPNNIKLPVIGIAVAKLNDTNSNDEYVEVIKKDIGKLKTIFRMK